jgi:hypothetical protein
MASQKLKTMNQIMRPYTLNETERQRIDAALSIAAAQLNMDAKMFIMQAQNAETEPEAEVHRRMAASAQDAELATFRLKMMLEAASAVEVF